jgi:hypothetical protein
MATNARTQLTPEEKRAGAVFRAAQQQALLDSFESDPPDFVALSWLHIYRHDCVGRAGQSTALALEEVDLLSPEYSVTTEGEPVTVPAGRFGFSYKVGTCRSCKKVARCRAGRLHDAYVRPPLEGRVAR